MLINFNHILKHFFLVEIHWQKICSFHLCAKKLLPYLLYFLYYGRNATYSYTYSVLWGIMMAVSDYSNVQYVLSTQKLKIDVAQ